MSNTPPDTPSRAPAGTAGETATRVFTDHRELLFSIVYSMLGSVADTEDVLQETWLAWAPRDHRPIASPRAYLVRIAVNAALARQAAIRRRRETYVGPWLPEPLVTAASAGHDANHDAGTGTGTGTGIGIGHGIGDGNGHDAAEPILRAESVSMALWVVLETLTPLERAVFVLYEVFGYAHTEIADILGRSPSAVRQLAHRAREHVQARRPRYRTDPRVRRQATERFLAAALGGDLDALMEILAPDVTMWTDGGGKVRASVLRPVRGRDKVARLIVGVTSHTPGNIDIRYRTVNGDPSALLFADDAPFAVMVVDLTEEGDQVAGIYAVTNPEKLSSIPREPEGTK